MKNLILTTLSVVYLCSMAAAQGNPNSSTHWKINGNLADSNKFLGTVNPAPIIFKTDNIERLRLSTDGKLGLGLNNPQAMLDVNGNVKFRNTLQLSNLTEFPPIETPSYFLVMDANGNVFKKSGGPLPDNPGPISICDFPNPDGTFGIPNPHWNSGFNKLFSECPNVLVGIATKTPRVNLDVIGTTYTSRLAIGNVNPATISNYFHLKTNSSNPSNSQNVILIESQFRKLMQLNNQGLLQVREVKIDLNTWPDYVFESNYNLMTLKQVENYIIENKHLPNVPDAKTIVEEGVNLGEINTILMEKIEELTLYLIEQEKRIETLETKINSKQ